MKQEYDNPEAEALFQKALDYRVGKKRGVKRDIIKARELYLEAIKLGSTKALINLANLYLQYNIKIGVSEEESYCYYLKYSQEAADKGRPEGYVNLYASYYNGDCVKADRKKALELLHKAVDMNHGPAMYRLGEIAQKKEPHSAEVSDWFEKALKQGYSQAAVKLFYFYYRQDLNKAIAYLKEGAKLGDKESLYYLYTNYGEGDMTFPKNEQLSNCYKKLERIASEKWNDFSEKPGITFPDLDERCPPDMKDE